MELTNFKISEDNIAVEQQGNYYDLHNNYDFIGFNYNTSNKTINIKWVVSVGDWVPKKSPEKLKITVSEVSLFKVRERNKAIPFTEDDCLSSIGFLWDELLEEMSGYTTHLPKKDCTHLILEFMSEFAVKIKAEAATLSIA